MKAQCEVLKLIFQHLPCSKLLDTCCKDMYPNMEDLSNIVEKQTQITERSVLHLEAVLRDSWSILFSCKSCAMWETEIASKINHAAPPAWS